MAQIATFGTMASHRRARRGPRARHAAQERRPDREEDPPGAGGPATAEALVKRPRPQGDPPDRRARDSRSCSSSPAPRGLARHISTHAAGVVIADKPIVEYVPLCTNGEDIVTQYPAPQLEELGLLKMDYLGLRTLTILAAPSQNIERQGGAPPDLEQLRLDDPKTFALLMSGDTQGVFQLESEGMRKLLQRLKPDCFEDLIAVLALYRPGPLESGMVDMFVRRKHGQEAIEYPHECLEEILRETYGCIVYQEQVMLISNTWPTSR